MTALRVGDLERLHRWVRTIVFGYATFPDWYAAAPEMDGVVILYSSVPGGTSAPYNLGRTLTHEVG